MSHRKQNKYIMFYKQHILIYQYHLHFANSLDKYTDDHLV